MIFKARFEWNIEYRTPNDEVEEWNLPAGRQVVEGWNDGEEKIEFRSEKNRKSRITNLESRRGKDRPLEIFVRKQGAGFVRESR